MTLPSRRPDPLAGGGGFNAYAAGNKSYGVGLRPFPNSGKVDNSVAARGYAERDRRNDAQNARREALMRRAGQVGV